MSTDPSRRINLAEIACDPRPQLPDGFRRNSTRVGTQGGATRTGLSVYEALNDLNDVVAFKRCEQQLP